jgi:hypothetical protein
LKKASDLYIELLNQDEEEQLDNSLVITLVSASALLIAYYNILL